MPDKILVNCQFGEDNVEKATIAFVAAHAAQTVCGKETAMFVTSSGIELATESGCDGLAAHGYKPLIDFRDAFLAAGGVIWVCPVCVDARNLDPARLVDGAEVAGIPKVMAYLESGAETLM